MEKQVIDGKVKWFDAAKGFGFIVSDSIEKDILLHANVLKDFGQSSISEGAEISVEVVSTDRGKQATKIVDVKAPVVDIGVALTRAQEFFPTVTEQDFSAPLEPVRVKWFDKMRGFGCLNRFGDDSDIFVHIEILRAFGLADLETGEAVSAKIADGARGFVAIEVRSWDFGLRVEKVANQ